MFHRLFSLYGSLWDQLFHSLSRRVTKKNEWKQNTVTVRPEANQTAREKEEKNAIASQHRTMTMSRSLCPWWMRTMSASVQVGIPQILNRTIYIMRTLFPHTNSSIGALTAFNFTRRKPNTPRTNQTVRMLYSRKYDKNEYRKQFA